jgi:hypothetical protein
MCILLGRSEPIPQLSGIDRTFDGQLLAGYRQEAPLPPEGRFSASAKPLIACDILPHPWPPALQKFNSAASVR